MWSSVSTAENLLISPLILGPRQKHWLGCFQNSEYWGFLSHKGPTHPSLHFPSHSSWFYSFIYFKVQFVMQLEDCQQGRVKWKVYFFSPVGKSWKCQGLLVGGSLGLFGLFFSRSPSLWENKVLLFSLSAKPKVEKLEVWFKVFFFFCMEQTKENSDAVNFLQVVEIRIPMRGLIILDAYNFWYITEDTLILIDKTQNKVLKHTWDWAMGRMRSWDQSQPHTQSEDGWCGHKKPASTLTLTGSLWGFKSPHLLCSWLVYE